MLALLILASAVRVVVLPLETDDAAPFVAARVTSLTVDALRAESCATVQGPVELGTGGAKAFENCFGQHSCLAAQTRAMGADVLVFGTVSKIAQTHSAELLVLDVETRRVRRSLRLHLPARLDALGSAMQKAREPLCRAVTPSSTPAADLDLPIEDIGLADDLAFVLPPPETPVVATTVPRDTPAAPVTAAAPATLPPTHPPVPAADPSPKVGRAAPTRTEVPRAALATTPTTRPEHNPSGRLSTPALAGLGLGAACLIGGTVLGLLSRGLTASDDVGVREGSTTHSLTRAEASRANSYALGANVFFVAGVLSGAAGSYFVWRDGFADGG